MDLKKDASVKTQDVVATTVKYKLAERAAENSNCQAQGTPQPMEKACFRNQVFKGSFGCEWKRY